QRTMFDIPRHLLRSHQHAFNLCIVDGREVASPIRKDPPACPFKQSNRCILQAALRNSQFQFSRRDQVRLAHFASPDVSSPMFFVKQLTVPSWHTSPSPSTSTLNSSASLSQSVEASITRRRLPLVSPFIHNFCRVRLQNVTNPVSSVFT